MEDLRKIVNDLIDKADMTEQGIADELGSLGVEISQPSINRLKNGTVKRPSFKVGRALVELHRKHVQAA